MDNSDSFSQLLDWLDLKGVAVEPRSTPSAARGLFAVQRIPPSTVLFTVPAHRLLNCRTLAPHYPPGLDAVQLIALHLSLYRPRYPEKSLDPLFGPYITTLPQDFDTHPLTCLLRGADIDELPPSVGGALERLKSRYLRDKSTVEAYAEKHSLSLTCDDFLWAWLNVNTRCIFHRMKRERGDADNITLCPILDLANHVVTGPCMTPRKTATEIANTAPIARLGDAFTLLSPDTVTEPGTELHLTYGAHSNRTLFVEYGFVIPADGARAEVDVQDLVETLFSNDKKEILEDAGYWGDWKLDASPAVSYRLITALRLLHIDSDSDLKRWWDTVAGLVETVSEANERAWKQTVNDTCSAVITRAEKHRTVSGWAVNDAVRELWAEETRVCLSHL
ncbi:hypothetical protein FB45DRAFT_912897 [Roridomyces roridus]|uniref:SET domain-containing protein n=1 Tax=Roridomyces roridus TaxID=1738132 RepID=A0AAD7FMC4_9AGAR|nr:hypothetical protein FB45DRAFT_912897 [Roridomyces roridus]